MIKKVLILGLGTVGQALYWDMIKKNYPACKVYFADLDFPNSPFMFIQNVDLVHICIPYTSYEQFKWIIYQCKKYSPKYILIHSTLPIDCVEKLKRDISAEIIHAPVRGWGTDKKLGEGMRKHPLFVSGYNNEILDYLIDLGFGSQMNKKEIGNEIFPIHILSTSKEVALNKLINTTWFGLQIAFCNMMYDLCKTLNIDFKESYIFSMTSDIIGRKYTKHKKSHAESPVLIRRPVMAPGNIGGKCVMQNLEFLKELCPELYTFMKKFSRIEENERIDNSTM